MVMNQPNFISDRHILKIFNNDSIPIYLFISEPMMIITEAQYLYIFYDIKLYDYLLPSISLFQLGAVRI